MIRKMDMMNNKQKNFLVVLLILIGGIFVYGGSGVAQQEAVPSLIGKGTVEVDGVRVPDIGPLPTAVPIPATNLNYKAKVKLGEQLYFDGRLSQNGAVSCAFCHTPGLGFADPKQVSVGVGGNAVAVRPRQSIIHPLTPCNFGMAAQDRSKSKPSDPSLILWKWRRLMRTSSTNSVTLRGT